MRRLAESFRGFFQKRTASSTESGRFFPGFPFEKSSPRFPATPNCICARIFPPRLAAPGKRQLGKTMHRRPKSRRIAHGRVLKRRRHKSFRLRMHPGQFVKRKGKRIFEKAGRRNRRTLHMRKQEHRVRNIKPRSHVAKASNETVIVSPLPNKRGITCRGRRADSPTLAKEKRCEVQAAHNAAARIEITTRSFEKRLFDSRKIRGFLPCIVHPGPRSCTYRLGCGPAYRHLGNAFCAAGGMTSERRCAFAGRGLKLALDPPQRPAQRKPHLEKRRESFDRIIERMLGPYAMQKHVRQSNASARKLVHEQRSRLHGNDVVHGTRHGTAKRGCACAAASLFEAAGIHRTIMRIGRCHRALWLPLA